MIELNFHTLLVYLTLKDFLLIVHGYFTDKANMLKSQKLFGHLMNEKLWN